MIAFVHGLDKARAETEVVVFDMDLVALLLENVGDLGSNSGHRAPTAQEEVVPLSQTVCHECWRTQLHAPSASLPLERNAESNVGTILAHWWHTLLCKSASRPLCATCSSVWIVVARQRGFLVFSGACGCV